MSIAFPDHTFKSAQRKGVLAMNQTKKTQASEADLVRELNKENSELRKKLEKLEKQLLSEKEQNRHSQDNFKNFFHSTIEFCWVLDEQGNIIAVN